MSFNSVFVLGPTAVGKTAVGVRLAASFGGEILSADSRQVYKGLDIGSGKDLDDYVLDAASALDLNQSLSDRIKDGVYAVPHHLIDVATLDKEYSLFDWTSDFYESFKDCLERKVLPVCVGGTGMYLDSILRKYDMIACPENPAEKAALKEKSFDELKSILISEKEKLHNTTEFGDRERLIKAILLNRFSKTEEYKILREKTLKERPRVEPLVIGTTLERSLVRKQIACRLKKRLDEGLIEEVESLHKNGATWRRLESLGLEYRFVSEYLQGKIKTKEELFELLNTAIAQFAKRQETWFRGMEKKGVKINWLPETQDIETRFRAVADIVLRSR